MENIYQKIVFVEDGSIRGEDVEKLKELGCEVIIYRQGANVPTILAFPVVK